MTKGEMIVLISDNVGINKAQAADAVETMLDAIMSAVAKGENITFVGFGTFSRALLAQRGSTTTRIPKFTPGAKFKAAVA
jgi:DNA-binding protein HU-beta